MSKAKCKSFGPPPTPSAHSDMEMPGSTVSTATSIKVCNTKNHLQQSTARQCQQQDKEDGTSPTTESAYDTACRLTPNKV